MPTEIPKSNMIKDLLRQDRNLPQEVFWSFVEPIQTRMRVQGNRCLVRLAQAGLEPGGQKMAKQLAQPSSQKRSGHSADANAHRMASADKCIPGRQKNDDNIESILCAAKIPAHHITEGSDHSVGGSRDQIGLNDHGGSKGGKRDSAAEQHKAVGQSLGLERQNIIIEKIHDPANQHAHGNLEDDLPAQRTAEQTLSTGEDEIEQHGSSS